MKFNIKEIKTIYPEIFQLTWVLNNICSNQCSYCNPFLYAGKNHNYKWENAKIFIDELFKRKNKINCSISGGEPTMSPFLLEICKLFFNNGHTIGITTNGTKSVQYYKEISKYLNHICFSYHPEYGDNNKLLEKIHACIENTKVTVRIMMHPTYWDESISFFVECLKNKNIGTEAVRILDRGQSDKNTYTYSDEQLKWFTFSQTRNNEAIIFIDNKEFTKMGSDFFLEDGTIDKNGHAVDYINEGLTDFYGWKCNIGLEHLYISAEGYIKRGNCEVGGFIGNIDEPLNIQWPENSIICNKHICFCTPDVLVSKKNLII
jgi:organic radical activating enzyme